MRKTLVKSFVLSNFNYCTLVWMFASSKSLTKIEKFHKGALRFTWDDYSISYETISEKSGKFSMDVKRKHKLCIKICKTLKINPSFMEGIFKLSLCPIPLREEYKLNLNIPRKKQVTVGTKSLEILGLKIWNNLPCHVKSAENLNVFKNFIKKWNVSSCSCNVCALKIFNYNIIPQMIFVLYL